MDDGRRREARPFGSSVQLATEVSKQAREVSSHQLPRYPQLPSPSRRQRPTFRLVLVSFSWRALPAWWAFFSLAPPPLPICWKHARFVVRIASHARPKGTSGYRLFIGQGGCQVPSSHGPPCNYSYFTCNSYTDRPVPGLRYLRYTYSVLVSLERIIEHRRSRMLQSQSGRKPPPLVWLWHAEPCLQLASLPLLARCLTRLAGRSVPR